MNSETENKSMKTLGLIGGTSWHSTIDYYSFINQSINDSMVIIRIHHF
ncbi:hypothetical protein JBL43_05360 [Aureibaculum sp. A20]|uniref:Aspartate racemase n=1 Tax=Aureibaculum flavum TaxID=2795986 RepID=A0ABS0WNU0_9FLAO|nr:hypothetical protein [Aureibaculum flavum]